MWTDSMYNTYAQFAYKEKCKVLHCLIFLTQCTQTECSELCHILLTVQTNSNSIIFCITCTHAQYSLHNSVTNSAHCVIFWTQCHILQRGVQCTQTQRDPAWVRLAAHLIAKQCKKNNAAKKMHCVKFFIAVWSYFRAHIHEILHTTLHCNCTATGERERCTEIEQYHHS